MGRTRWTGKRRAIVIATLTLACVAFLWMAAPVPVSSSELGSNWQCSKTAFVLTTCTKLVSHSLGQPGNPHRFDHRAGCAESPKNAMILEHWPFCHLCENHSRRGGISCPSDGQHAHTYCRGCAVVRKPNVDFPFWLRLFRSRNVHRKLNCWIGVRAGGICRSVPRYDGGSDHVGGALLAFRASGHSRPRPC
jgi:hypothetical protein